MVAKHVALYGILALGMTFVIITGGIDLSVGSVVGLVGMLAGGMIQEGITLKFAGVTLYFSVPVIIITMLVVGCIIGACLLYTSPWERKQRSGCGFQG